VHLIARRPEVHLYANLAVDVHSHGGGGSGGGGECGGSSAAPSGAAYGGSGRGGALLLLFAIAYVILHPHVLHHFAALAVAD
jgi:hypothetical protein